MRIENDRNKVFVKVPAKLIISGEHSVVYNKKSVVCTIGMYLNITLKKCGFLESKKNKIIIIDNGKKLYFDVNGFFNSKNNKGDIFEILKSFFTETKTKPQSFKVVINNNIPQNYGLGSSASLVVGLLFGLNEFFKTNIDVDRMLKVATETENIFHKKSSGVDIKAVLLGGVLFFNQDWVIKLPKPTKRVFLINTGKPDFKTKDVVGFVKEQQNNKTTWDDFGVITERICKQIQLKKPFFEEIRKNQELLEKINVVSLEVKTFLKELLSQKIYGKICGAGTIGKDIKTTKSGVVGIFHELTTKQFGFLKKACKKNKFTLKVVDIVDGGLFCKVL